MSGLSRRSEVQSEKRAAIEQALLQALEDLLAEGASYADLRIEQIGARAGISRTAFYFYFPDKRALLMRAVEDLLARLYELGEQWWQGTGDGRQDLEQALRGIVELYAEHRTLVIATSEAASFDEEIGRFWRGLIGRFVEANRERIAAQAPDQADGAEPLAFVLVWAVEKALLEWSVQQPGFSREDLLAAILHVWFGAVYPD